MRQAPRERRAAGSREVQEVSVFVRSSELPLTCNSEPRIMQIDFETDSARLVQTMTNTLLGRLSEAGGLVQVPGRARVCCDGLQRCKRRTHDEACVSSGRLIQRRKTNVVPKCFWNACWILSTSAVQRDRASRTSQSIARSEEWCENTVQTCPGYSTDLQLECSHHPVLLTT